MTNFWKKIGDEWCVSCVTPQQTGDVVTVTNRSGESKTVTLGERCAGLASTFKVARQPRAEAPQAQAVGDLSGLLALFARTVGKLKFPAIVIQAGDTTLRLTVASPRAKVPGSVTVTTLDKVFNRFEGEYQREWLGRVTVDGTYQPARAANGRTDAISAKLRELAQDPAKVAAEYGRATACCAFCMKPLGGVSPDSPEGRKSLAVGYGRKCASNYGLPWGDAKFTFKAEEV